MRYRPLGLGLHSIEWCPFKLSQSGAAMIQRLMEGYFDFWVAIGSKKANVLGNSQGGVSLKCHSFVEFVFDERNLGDLGLRL